MGIILVLAEFVIPGMLVIFFGTSAIIVGLLVWIGLPQTNGIAFVLFASLSVAQIIILRRFFKRWFTGDSLGSGERDDGMQEFIGKEVEVAEDFNSDLGRGKVVFKGASWSARSNENLTAGETAVIADRDGLTLIVKKLEK